jgi:hypothetical protein
MAGLACAIADGAEVISDFRVIGNQSELFGLGASVPTAWRTLAEIAGGGERRLGMADDPSPPRNASLLGSRFAALTP